MAVGAGLGLLYDPWDSVQKGVNVGTSIDQNRRLNEQADRTQETHDRNIKAEDAALKRQQDFQTALFNAETDQDFYKLLKTFPTFAEETAKIFDTRTGLKNANVGQFLGEAHIALGAKNKENWMALGQSEDGKKVIGLLDGGKELLARNNPAEIQEALEDAFDNNWEETVDSVEKMMLLAGGKKDYVDANSRRVQAQKTRAEEIERRKTVTNEQNADINAAKLKLEQAEHADERAKYQRELAQKEEDKRLYGTLAGGGEAGKKEYGRISQEQTGFQKSFSGLQDAENIIHDAFEQGVSMHGSRFANWVNQFRTGEMTPSKYARYAASFGSKTLDIAKELSAVLRPVSKEQFDQVLRGLQGKSWPEALQAIRGTRNQTMHNYEGNMQLLKQNKAGIASVFEPKLVFKRERGILEREGRAGGGEDYQSIAAGKLIRKGVDPKKAYESVGLKFPGYTPEEDKKWGKKDDAQPEEQKPRKEVDPAIYDFLVQKNKAGVPSGSPPKGYQPAPESALADLEREMTLQKLQEFVKKYKYIP